MVVPQLCEAETGFSASECDDPTVAIAFSDRNVLLGSCTFAIFAVISGTANNRRQHEKLCVIDQTIAFTGGVDLCFGR